MDLSEFLLARIGEEQAEADAASVDMWGHRVGSREGFEWTSLALSSERDTTRVQDEFIARWDPARVLAECEAKRRIVKLMAPEYLAPDVLALLAMPYADHPEYQSEWKP